jgi:flagellar biosynthesis regulator FlaF
MPRTFPLASKIFDPHFHLLSLNDEPKFGTSEEIDNIQWMKKILSRLADDLGLNLDVSVINEIQISVISILK